MTRPQKAQARSSGRRQTGATLLVAIMLLLIITLLALSSMRGVSLESRITGNLKQQKNLMNAAEAGLRMGELSVAQWKCQPNATYKPCLSMPAVNTNGDYSQQFAASRLAYINANTTGYDAQIQWYVVDLRLLGGQAQNTCGISASGCGRHFYEVTACASSVLCSSDTTTPRVILRSVVSYSN